jgi:hypothetical protein
MAPYILLLMFLSCSHGDVLSDLISFARGGGGNFGAASTPDHARPQAPAARSQAPAARPRQRTQSSVAALIPFAELADPSRGTVQLDVPQPKQASPQAAAINRQQLVEASSPPRFAGLPAGSTQVGGGTVNLAPRQKNRPAPLSEIRPPIYMSEDFRNPLNDVNPFRAALPEPVEALQHRFLPGNRPNPVNIQSQNLPVIMVLNDPSIQRGIHNQVVDYDSFTGDIFSQGQQQFSNAQQPDLGRVQADLSHQEALTRHRLALEQAQRVTQQQQLPQQQYQPPQQQQYQQPQQQQYQQPQQQFQPQVNQQQHTHQNPLSRFSIPGIDTLRQYEEELRLAQEALKNLG